MGERGREGERERGSEGVRERGREGERERGREGERAGVNRHTHYMLHAYTCVYCENRHGENHHENCHGDTCFRPPTHPPSSSSSPGMDS